MSIKTLLLNLGVEWKKGYMQCPDPQCAQYKLTASETRDIATCWACGKHWRPGMKHKYKCSWGTWLMKYIAAKAQDHLEKDTGTLEWLTNKRQLKQNLQWYLDHNLGSFPPNLDLSIPIAKAKVILEDDLSRALALCTDEEQKEDIIAEFDREKDRLNTFVKDTLIPTCAIGMLVDALVFIYTNAHGDPLSLNIRQWRNEEVGNKAKTIRRLQPILGRRGVFNPVRDSGAFWGERVPTIIVEGEVNWLQLQAQAARWEKPKPIAKNRPTGFEWMDDLDAAPLYSLPGLAVGGKEGADLQTLRGILVSETPLVCYDSDAIDMNTGKVRGYSLVEAVNWATPILEVTTAPYKDADDWVKAANPQPDDILALVERAIYRPRPYEAAAEDIQKAIAMGGRADVVKKRVTEKVWDDLRMRATIYNAGGTGVVVTRDPVNNEVIHVRQGHPTWNALMLKYGIEASDPLCEALGKNVGVRVATEECVTKIDCLPVLSHYNTETRALYVDELDRVLRINRDGSVDIIRNGDDGVVFSPAGDVRQADLTLPLGSLENHPGALETHLLSSVNWDTSKGVSVKTAKQLYKAHLMSIFFADLIHDKATPLFEGPAGGGKNMVTSLTGMLFQGKDFTVLPMPKKPEKLDEQTVDCIYAGFDEYDATDHDMESALRSWCTRQTAERRELFTTWDKAKRPLARGMGLSTNGNPTRAIATGQRLLMFSVLARQNNYEDAKYQGAGMHLVQQFMKVRNAIWSELISDLRMMVEALGEVPDFSQKTGYRMADFGALILICAKHEGWDAEAEAMLKEMTNVQSVAMAAKSLMVSLLEDYLQAAPDGWDTMRTLAEWNNVLLDTIPHNDKKARQQFTRDYVRYMVTGQGRPMMDARFVVIEGNRQNGKWDSHSKVNRYAFELKGSCGEISVPRTTETEAAGSLK